VHLTGKEYQMLELLSLRKGTTLTKEMFLDHLYGGMDEPELKIIDVFICKLRKKLADASAGRNYIETVWGRGYVLLKAAIARKPPVAQSRCAGSTVRSPSTSPRRNRRSREGAALRDSAESRDDEDPEPGRRNSIVTFLFGKRPHERPPRGEGSCDAKFYSDRGRR
jgi:DNA-binding winged helix-turn-helix (wHTH) protein